ncbi:DUF1996 domain-containing protein, partial [Salmonella enterica subsp. enterica serovar Montevideo]|nr:DUF1996 domain-containing protein [Salmonella enterica subsp. enterica serovar Montevideo]
RKAGDAVQFNIGIAFPNCWDGVNLKPTHIHNNAIYADHGKCSSEVEGTMGQYSNPEGGMYLVESPEDVWTLNVKNEGKLSFMTQT